MLVKMNVTKRGKVKNQGVQNFFKDAEYDITDDSLAKIFVQEGWAELVEGTEDTDGDEGADQNDSDEDTDETDGADDDTQGEELDLELLDLDGLKLLAKDRGIDFHPNIGEEKLRERLHEELNAEEDE